MAYPLAIALAGYLFSASNDSPFTPSASNKKWNILDILPICQTSGDRIELPGAELESEGDRSWGGMPVALNSKASHQRSACKIKERALLRLRSLQSIEFDTIWMPPEIKR